MNEENKIYLVVEDCIYYDTDGTQWTETSPYDMEGFSTKEGALNYIEEYLNDHHFIHPNKTVYRKYSSEGLFLRAFTKNKDDKVDWRIKIHCLRIDDTILHPRVPGLLLSYAEEETGNNWHSDTSRGFESMHKANIYLRNIASQEDVDQYFPMDIHFKVDVYKFGKKASDIEKTEHLCCLHLQKPVELINNL